MLAFSVFKRGRRLTVRARAKVNLGLEVLGRRSDGYHELLTYLSAIELADYVTMETTAGGIEVHCDAPEVPGSRQNLAWRAADLLRRETRARAGVRIGIAKAIPVAAGLGGGSTDAAAVLWGLSQLWGVRVARARLHALAMKLGMDVPFFLGDGPALASGRGEQLAWIPRHRGLSLVLVNPGFPLVTQDVYARLGPDDWSDGTRLQALVSARAGGAPAVAERVWNALEAVVTGLWPGLTAVKSALLDAGALGAVMSGSGPTVIGIARSPAAARAIREAIAAHPWQTWVTRTVSGPALATVRGMAETSGKQAALGRGQAARRGTLDPVFGGSNPPAPTTRMKRAEGIEEALCRMS